MLVRTGLSKGIRYSIDESMSPINAALKPSTLGLIFQHMRRTVHESERGRPSPKEDEKLPPQIGVRKTHAMGTTLLESLDMIVVIAHYSDLSKRVGVPGKLHNRHELSAWNCLTHRVKRPVHPESQSRSVP